MPATIRTFPDDMAAGTLEDGRVYLVASKEDMVRLAYILDMFVWHSIKDTDWRMGLRKMHLSLQRVPALAALSHDYGYDGSLLLTNGCLMVDEVEYGRIMGLKGEIFGT